MKIDQFFRTLTNNPDAKAACSLFRATGDRMVFMHDTECSSKTWRLAAIWDDEMVLLSRPLIDYWPKKNFGTVKNDVTEWLNSVRKNRMVINVSRLGVAMPPSSRKVKDKASFIQESVLRSVNMYDVVRQNEVRDWRLVWWDIAWCDAICRAASTVCEANSKTASILTSTAFDGSTRIGDVILDLQARASADDFSKATVNKMKDLQEIVQTLSNKLSQASSQIFAANVSVTKVRLPYPFPWHYSKDAYVQNLNTDLLMHNRINLSFPDETSLFDYFPTLDRFFRRVGLTLPEPFGLSVCSENITKLAVLKDTARLDLIDPPFAPWYEASVVESPTQTNTLLA